MGVLQITAKYDLGDQVFIITPSTVSTKCEICKGEKSITIDGHEFRCPQCHGTGENDTAERDARVIETPYTVERIKISVRPITLPGAPITIRYKLKSGEHECSRAEEHVFPSLGRAREYCDFLNKKRTMIALDDIMISPKFARTIPNPDKIAARIAEYKRNRTFRSEIVLTNELVLTDGYATYLVCKMLGIPEIKVIIDNYETERAGNL